MKLSAIYFGFIMFILFIGSSVAEPKLIKTPDCFGMGKKGLYDKIFKNMKKNNSDDLKSKVQAQHNDILPTFFGSWERRHIQELRDTQLNRREPIENVEHEKAEFAEFRRRRQKKNKKIAKNTKTTPKNSVKLAEKKRRKKRRKNKSNRRFVKTTLNEINRDSKMSDSKDSDRNGKPVDIIVHIKMND